MAEHETTTVSTLSVSEVAAALVGDSMRDGERWVVRQIRSGRFRARKVGRTWRFTQQDFEHALDALANHPAKPSGQPSTGSLRRRRIA